MSSSPQGGAEKDCNVNKTQVGPVVLPSTLEDSQHCGEGEVGPARRPTAHLSGQGQGLGSPPAGLESVGGLCFPR